MKRRWQMIMLLWGCILMQVATVFPHHHHADVFCLHHDAGTSGSANTSRGCSSECITRFNLTLPSVRFVLHKETGRTAYADWVWCMWGGFFCHVEDEPVRRIFDRPFYCGFRPSGGIGLRAPPCGSFLI